MSKIASGLIYQPGFIKPQQRAQILEYLASLRPIWEERYSKSNPPPDGKTQRTLLRPVYWLGNWQFACLNYYHPPKGLFFRCMDAEPYPKVLGELVMQIEDIVRTKFPERDIPKGWQLNTCLINFYGDNMVDGKSVDAARVGEHKDFEPGPVGSLSIGERALFQFVDSPHRDAKSQVVQQQWLEDCSLQIFGGDRYKKKLFHRVQRVDTKLGFDFPMPNMEFKTRRINFTFRFVPPEHIKPFQKFPPELQSDIRPYVENLARNSDYWREQL